MHRYLPPGVEEGTPPNDTLSQSLSIDGPLDPSSAQNVDTVPFEKYDPLLHAGLSYASESRSSRAKNKKKEVLSIPFVKKYIQYAKARPAPALTKGASDLIVHFYASLRNDELESSTKRVRRSSEIFTMMTLTT